MRRMGIHVVPVVVLMVSWMAMLAGDPARAAGEEYEMTTYQFAMLVDGPERDAIQGEAAEDKQRQHVEFLTGLLDDGTALVAGPVEGAAPIRGIVVLTVDTVAAAEEILAADPWVKAGHLALEIHPWWAARDIILKAPDPLSHETCWLGLIRRPADAPELAEARLKELQKGHMANIQAMADSGDLVIAGPAGDWHRDQEGRFVNTDSGRPVMHLDDLVVVLRQIGARSGNRFGCSITPRQDSLARVNAFLAK